MGESVADPPSFKNDLIIMPLALCVPIFNKKSHQTQAEKGLKFQGHQFANEPENKLRNFFSGSRIRIFDQDSTISGFFDFLNFDNVWSIPSQIVFEMYHKD